MHLQQTSTALCATYTVQWVQAATLITTLKRHYLALLVQSSKHYGFCCMTNKGVHHGSSLV